MLGLVITFIIFTSAALVDVICELMALSLAVRASVVTAPIGLDPSSLLRLASLSGVVLGVGTNFLRAHTYSNNYIHLILYGYMQLNHLSMLCGILHLH